MVQKAKEDLSSSIKFEVDFIRVYYKVEKNKYIKYIDIPLG